MECVFLFPCVPETLVDASHSKLTIFFISTTTNVPELFLQLLLLLPLLS